MGLAYTQRTYYPDNKIRKETVRTAAFVMDIYYSPLGHKEKRIKVFDKRTNFQELFFQEGPIKEQIFYSDGFGTISVKFELFETPDGKVSSRKIMRTRSLDHSSVIKIREYDYWNTHSVTKKQITDHVIDSRTPSKNKTTVKLFDEESNSKS